MSAPFQSTTRRGAQCRAWHRAGTQGVINTAKPEVAQSDRSNWNMAARAQRGGRQTPGTHFPPLGTGQAWAEAGHGVQSHKQEQDGSTSSRGGIQHTDSCGLADRHRELERQGDRAGGGTGTWGEGKASTYLVRVGAMGHSGFTNYGAGREKQRKISEVISPQGLTWQTRGAILETPAACGDMGQRGAGDTRDGGSVCTQGGLDRRCRASRRPPSAHTT